MGPRPEIDSDSFHFQDFEKPVWKYRLFCFLFIFGIHTMPVYLNGTRNAGTKAIQMYLGEYSWTAPLLEGKNQGTRLAGTIPIGKSRTNLGFSPMRASALSGKGSKQRRRHVTGILNCGCLGRLCEVAER